MQPSDTQDIMSYISDFYRTTDIGLNQIGRDLMLLKNHITRLYVLRGDCDFPRATGHLRLKQLGALTLLKMVDSVLRNAGIKYFLSYGNLLGAARGGEFIPWDDDVDICLMRDDFNRAVTVLTEHFNHGEFYTKWGISGGIFKVLFTNKICIDLFPWDTYHTRLTTRTQRDEFTEKYIRAMNIARQLESDQQTLSQNPNAIVQSTHDDYCAIRDDIIMDGMAPDYTNGDIFEGIDWQTYPERTAHFYHHKPFRHEWIFPLGQIEFCGYKFPAPNNIDAVLTTRFGDWHEYRPDFARHSPVPFEYEELELVK
ncbi:MAG: LicD family protein, partial [Lachnospiraceae bacterium]|nr:LicD family protein [Lachnospiraceae bacterium]